MKIHLDLTSSDAQIKWFHKVSKPTQPWNQRRFQCHYRNNSLQTCSTSKICNNTIWKHMPPSLCYLSYHAMLENCIANIFHFVGSSKKCTCIQIEIFDKNATKEKKTQFKMYWVCLESASWCYSFISFLFFWASCKSLIFQNIVFVPRFTVMHWLRCQKVQKLSPLTFCLHLRKIPDWKDATRNTYFWKTNTLHIHLLVDKNASMKAIKACNKTKKSHWGLKAIEACQDNIRPKPIRFDKSTAATWACIKAAQTAANVMAWKNNLPRCSCFHALHCCHSKYGRSFHLLGVKCILVIGPTQWYARSVISSSHFLR